MKKRKAARKAQSWYEARSRNGFRQGRRRAESYIRHNSGFMLVRVREVLPPRKRRR